MAKTFEGKSKRLGGGGMFAEIAHKAAQEYGSKEAGERVAAAVGREHLGNKKMTELSEHGREREEKKEEKKD